MHGSIPIFSLSSGTEMFLHGADREQTLKALNVKK